MGNKITRFKAWIRGITTLSSSRWGIFNILFAVAAMLISIGIWRDISIKAWGDIHLLIKLGLAILVLDIIIAIIWLVRGSKDPTATKDDINNLGEKIERLLTGTNEILTKLDRIISLLEHKSNE